MLVTLQNKSQMLSANLLTAALTGSQVSTPGSSKQMEPRAALKIEGPLLPHPDPKPHFMRTCKQLNTTTKTAAGR